ncbi:MAG TPA: peptide chain release factor N(5)-glutamine methyltransferase [Candidatus Hydrogenedentes bacterium]|nr:peptide chain release factor N(5)-glutamine methyltransferase [Candidatus Hydrogenedentota bacterium]HQE84259.1 peptide chain release factor N(5)-glutamine methyltransferase [Candidatus Hydrogenedentota bacterium]HQH51271.1 peptide chain release factor N(5)-glutamine methyltransferase [Candidatus Hydrogenedentota bacterium]HQM50582.1 peptide chain release factor N(5)-glutamine methyltransferase [Candidatus Hydrogenedentota bacterium]
MATVAERLSQAATQLAAVTDTPRLDAEILMAHAAGISRAVLLSRLQETFSGAPGFEASLERRLQYEPLAYIIGEWEFFSLDFLVQAPLLVPRPETEHVVEAVLERVAAKSAAVLELGTGTGCIAVSIAHAAPGVSVIATDIQPAALTVAQHNAERHGVTQRLALRQGDLFAALRPGDGPFDAICSNPPYIEESAWPGLDPVIRLHEDPGALLGGQDGLAVIRRLVAEASDWLMPGGLLAFEIGMGQYEHVRDLLQRNDYAGIRFVRDLAGIERVAVAENPG